VSKSLLVLFVSFPDCYILRFAKIDTYFQKKNDMFMSTLQFAGSNGALEVIKREPSNKDHISDSKKILILYYFHLHRSEHFRRGDHQ
jgi:hypothetical protein